ncbi:META domain-containing protein [Vibrio breoganii]|uniref:META domain-containing protein n=1 Tax=Vibrio breoganii TaxID=553239 RepID=UPI000C838296|nr:META domain-containing protein [Vibrio breoganii]PMG92902.1 heat-shock protein HslJ [Vibrio breoganii]PMG95869.1 heat-shock protein HslJ [Vibrio breoganii]PMJ47138.1 heat-shock protein HslJ [Vibrio breoganii]PMK61577.1 heat-shock protein HslJ [Vibrio breoganii]PMO28109.1 heat-shock protein HslJ [Vibrio breoganii]
MYKKLTAISAALLISACSSMGSNDADKQAMDSKAEMEMSAETLQVNEQALQHHHWVLTHIDGKAVEVDENFKAPTLEVGEKMTTNGNAGCNNFFGQGELKDGKFRIQQMGMTMKMCPEGVMNTEMAYSKALSEWNDVVLTKQTMELKSVEHTLTFQLKDWVN